MTEDNVEVLQAMNELLRATIVAREKTIKVVEAEKAQLFRNEKKDEAEIAALKDTNAALRRELEAKSASIRTVLGDLDKYRDE